MSLSEEDRKTLVSLEQEKAHTFLEQADEMYKQRYWDIASTDIIMHVFMLYKPCSFAMV